MRGHQEAVRRGALAQEMAALYLRLRGLSILDANRRGAGGEIDLLARDANTLVFVEVRLRGCGAWSTAAASVGAGKRARLRDCARHLLRHREDLRWPGRQMRFDVVAIDLEGHGCRLGHLRGVQI
jgi:putative endonuclease